MKTGKKSFRMRFDFWLDVAKSDQHELAEYLEDMKHKRLFSKTIRDGVRLIRDLRAGNLTVLLELFPTLADRLQPEGTSDLAALVDQFKQMMTQNAGQVDRPSLPMPLPSFDSSQAVKVTAVFDETAVRELSIANALAALDDF